MSKFIKSLIEDKFSRLVFTVGLTFGLLVVFITPPLQFADEDSHFKKAYLTSTLQIFPTKHSNSEFGNCIPTDILSFIESHRYMMGTSNVKYTYSQLYSLSATPRQEVQDSCQWNYFSSSAANPILYIPQAIGIAFGRIIYLPVVYVSGTDFYNPVTMLMFARLANLIFYICSLSVVVKISPILKRTFIVLGLMPMSLSIAASVSYDTVVISACFLTLALIFRLLFDENAVFNKRNLVSLIILSAILVHLKTVYILILGLLILLPKEKFKNSRRRILFFVGIMASVLISFFGWRFLFDLLGTQITDQSDVRGQLNFIINNPLEFINISLYSIKSNLIFWANGFVGNLGWLDTNFPYGFIVCFYLFMGLTFLSDARFLRNITVKFRLVCAFVFASIVLSLELVLYLIWTSIPSVGGVGYPFISGVQGRYFIPAFVIGLLPFSFRLKSLVSVLKIFDEVFYEKFIIFSASFTIFILLLRYWIPEV